MKRTIISCILLVLFSALIALDPLSLKDAAASSGGFTKNNMRFELMGRSCESTTVVSYGGYRTLVTMCVSSNNGGMTQVTSSQLN